MSRPLESVAYHEAGHVVVMLGLGFPVQSATIVPQGHILGGVMPAAPPPPAVPGPPLTDGEVGLLLLAAATVDVAGGVADDLAGFVPSGLESDEESVDSIGGVVWDRLNVPVFRWRHLVRAEAERYLRDQWAAVQRVATALLVERTMTGARARQVAGDIPALDVRTLAGALDFWRWREGQRTAQRTV